MRGQTMKKMVLGLLVILLAGCAQGVSYVPPIAKYTQPKNIVVVNMSKNKLWRKIITKISQNFYVVNSMDKESGFINISYSGNPEPYVDCGMLTAEFSSAVEQSSQTFPGAVQKVDYTLLKRPRMYNAHREMRMDGRVSIILQEDSKTATMASINTRYTLKRTMTLTSVDYRAHARTQTAYTEFNMGQSGTLPGSPDYLQCVPTGEFERKIIGLIKK
jgi:hypothetical protein